MYVPGVGDVSQYAGVAILLKVLGPESKSRARFSSSLYTLFAGFFFKNLGTGVARTYFILLVLGLSNFVFLSLLIRL